MLAWCRRSALALLFMASLTACEAVDPIPESPADGGANLLDVDGSVLLPAEMCAPECTPAPYGPPLWVDSESLCYDGCNWCTCTADGPMNCTARDCSGLEAPDGGSAPLPAEMCAPACVTEFPEPPFEYDPATTCYDGCNWCTCTADGPADCTARDCSASDDFDGGMP